ncbi:UDP-3-O-(3-hydroxymyristoyl)glucosamine N-acyltransferase [Synechococcus elongatus IITB4]|uniref:UDP-3-O-(3-hydroxymyristoyl)glucosamine N-acyltransferase n=1 Tax=Synechococcus elongatus TaxID=32046 RepID=UPI0030CAB5B2
MRWSEFLQHLEAKTGPCTAQAIAGDPELHGVAAINEAQAGQVSFLDQESGLQDWIEQTAASALILPPDPALQARAEARNLAWVTTAQPRLAFAAAIAIFYQPFRPAPGIHPSAVVDPSAQLGDRVSVGAHVVIGANSVIGNDVILHANVVLYPGVIVGDRSQLHANSTIHERSQIGQDCVIHSGAVIGAEGFGFVPTASGWFKMEQSGVVVLEDGVEVGCNSAIDRPAVGETRIGAQTKLDNLVHIGHGCQIGKACAMAAQVGLAGGVEVGDRVILAGQVGVANRVKIGDRAIASSKSGIHGEIEAGAIVSGYPAIPNRQWLKTSAVYNRLPELYRSLRNLVRRVEVLEQGRSES